jgi:transcriptional regulator with XRE-family HTH domain
MQHRTPDIERREILAANIKEFVAQEFERKYDMVIHSKEEIAKAIGVTTRQLERYMSGTSEPTAITIFKFCEFLEYDLQRIFLTEVEWSICLGDRFN